MEVGVPGQGFVDARDPEIDPVVEADEFVDRVGVAEIFMGEVAGDERGSVIARRSPLSAAGVRISSVPGATVFRVRGVGMPVVSLGTARIVADALRRSPEFRAV